MEAVRELLELEGDLAGSTGGDPAPWYGGYLVILVLASASASQGKEDCGK